ncbi:MAG: hypothetical protein M0Z52_02045 [Actinomycetota bacterium]|nr:hypothetical protein [Actinomycetota bacterium]
MKRLSLGIILIMLFGTAATARAESWILWERTWLENSTNNNANHYEYKIDGGYPDYDSCNKSRKDEVLRFKTGLRRNGKAWDDGPGAGEMTFAVNDTLKASQSYLCLPSNIIPKDAESQQ